MRLFSRILIAACGIIMSLALLTGIASASRAIKAESRNPITGTARGVTFRGAFATVICNVTLRGELGTLREGRFTVGSPVTVLKTSRGEESVFARITEGRTESCVDQNRNAAEALVLADAAGREFLLGYAGFEGTLPNIRVVSVNVSRAAFRITAAGLRCLFSSASAVEASELRASARESGGRLSYNRMSFTAAEARATYVSGEGSFLCGGTGSLEATGTAEFNVSPAILVSLVA